MRRLWFGVMVFSLVLMGPLFAFGQMSSASYQIRLDSLSSGGGAQHSDGYGMTGQVGEPGAGTIASSTYSIRGGLQGGIYDEVMQLSLYGLDESTEVAALAYTGGTGGVLTVTDASDFITDTPHDTFIVVFENKGTDNEEVFFSSLESVSLEENELTLYVDNNPENIGYASSAGSGPQVNDVLNVDGVNDFVYLMASPIPARSFGSLSRYEVASQAYFFQTSSDDDLGYKLYVAYNDAGDSLVAYPGVADGHVSVGETEIGGRSTDRTVAGSTFDTQDTAITTTYQQFADRNTGVLRSRDGFVVRAAMKANEDPGTYEGDISFAVLGAY